MAKEDLPYPRPKSKPKARSSKKPEQKSPEQLEIERRNAEIRKKKRALLGEQLRRMRKGDPKDNGKSQLEYCPFCSFSSFQYIYNHIYSHA